MDIENVVTVKEAEEIPGDYYDAEGLLVCGCCGQRKEKIVSLFNGRPMRVRCICLCEEMIQAEQRRQDELRQEQERIQRLRNLSMMDVRYTEAAFDKCEKNADNEKNINLGKRYVEEFKKFYEEDKGLIFWGDVGTGKSYLAACIANELMANGYPVIMTSFVRALEIIRKGSDEEEEFMRAISTAKLVIFDDLGSERNTDFALEKVFNIVDTRYRSGRPMIFTTNLKLRDMVSEADIRYKRIYDRIFEVCYPMEFKGASWRKVKAREMFSEL